MAGTETGVVKDCNLFWGSHGCGLPEGHEGHHLCAGEDELCSEYNGTEARFMQFEWNEEDQDWTTEVGWSEWIPMSSFR